MAYAVSTAFRSALDVDHDALSTVTVIDSTGATLATLQVIDGSVTMDLDRSIKREAGDITVIDKTGTLTPTTVTSILSPLSGNELLLSRGIQYFDGTTELVPLGVFGFQSLTVDVDGAGVKLTIGSLQDRAARISRAKYPTPYSVVTATALETVVAGLLQRGWPGVPGTGSFPTTGITISSRSWGSDGDSDPWNDAVDLCDDHGYRLYFDEYGVAQMVQIQDLSTLTATVTYDTTNPLILSISRQWDTFNTYNGVIAIGEGSGLLIPYRAVAWDDDPTSPTYYLGNYGKRPRVYSSPNLYSKADAVRTATAQLRKTLGVTETVTWEQIPDPSLQPGDGVQVTITSAAVNNLYRIDRVEIPLDPASTMSVTARAKRVSA